MRGPGPLEWGLFLVLALGFQGCEWDGGGLSGFQPVLPAEAGAEGAAEDSLCPDCRFEMAPQWLPPSHVSFIPYIKILRTGEWPSLYQRFLKKRKMKVGKHSVGVQEGFFDPIRGYQLLPFDNFTVHAHLLPLFGTKYFFLSKRTRRSGQASGYPYRYTSVPDRWIKEWLAPDSASRRPQTLHALVYLKVDPDGFHKSKTLWTNIGGGPFGQDLKFEVKKFQRKAVLVYPDFQSIVQVLATPTKTGLEFGEPRPVHQGESAVTDLQLVPGKDYLHMIWTERGTLGGEDRKLYYTRTQNPERKWDPPKLISGTVFAGTANLVVRDQTVFIAWSDYRFREKRWDSYINSAKIFLARGEKEGKEFNKPFLLNREKDAEDVAQWLWMVPAGAEDLVFFWKAEEGTSWMGSLFTGRLNAAGEFSRHKGVVKARDLLQTYRLRMKSFITVTGG